MARRAKGLGLTVIAYDPYASDEKARAQGVRLVPFDEALALGDFFSLHMPLTPQTKVPRRSAPPLAPMLCCVRAYGLLRPYGRSIGAC